MKTRFDDRYVWRTKYNDTHICDMETDHLINTLNMFITKPQRVMSMLIRDIEHYQPILDVWTPNDDGSAIKESLSNATSMTTDELTAYALNSPLGKAMIDELEIRGVNTDNVIAIAMDSK